LKLQVNSKQMSHGKHCYVLSLHISFFWRELSLFCDKMENKTKYHIVERRPKIKYQNLRKMQNCNGISDSNCNGISDSNCNGISDSNCNGISDSNCNGISDSQITMDMFHLS
jgi:bacterioferritin-associated ferredoxin